MAPKNDSHKNVPHNFSVFLLRAGLAIEEARNLTIWGSPYSYILRALLSLFYFIYFVT